MHIYPTNSSTCPLMPYSSPKKTGTTLSKPLVFSAGTFSPLTPSKLTELSTLTSRNVPLKIMHHIASGFV